jgi:hypothetical protein
MEQPRGRPRKYDYEQLEKFAAQVSRAKTLRGRQDVDRAGHAAAVIMHAVQEGVVPEPQRTTMRELVDNMRPSVFAELGRFIDDDDSEEGAVLFWKAVHFLLENPEMSAKRTIRHLRRFRLGGGGDTDTSVALHHALMRAVIEHLERYPELDQDQVESALHLTLAQCRSLEIFAAASE